MAESKSIGRVEAIFRYPVKSMACQPLEVAEVGWHGLEGDRRFAVRRLEEAGGKPWLTASKLPDLLRFTPFRREGATGGLPTHVRTPDGRELPVAGEELAAEIARLHGRPVQILRLDHGIFDEGTISVITPATIDEIGAASGRELEARRFRPNILIRTDEPRAFDEDRWVGSVLSFGDDGGGPEVSVTLRDERCAMLNLDPDSARSDPQVLKAAVRLNENYAGVYGTVVRRGRLSVGQSVRLRG
jgi:MOSC domain-containing protein